jgi:hypothetical protein
MPLFQVNHKRKKQPSEDIRKRTLVIYNVENITAFVLLEHPEI